MSGVSIIGALLLADADVLAKVPAARIKAGMLNDGIALPALLVRSVSLVERVHLVRGETVRVKERVSVTVRAANYKDQRAIIKLVRDACAGEFGTIAGFENASVINAGTGPDVIGPGNTFEQTQDFMTSFNEPV